MLHLKDPIFNAIVPPLLSTRIIAVIVITSQMRLQSLTLLTTATAQTKNPIWQSVTRLSLTLHAVVA